MSKDLPQFNISWRKFQYMRNTKTYIKQIHMCIGNIIVLNTTTNKMHEVSWSI